MNAANDAFYSAFERRDFDAMASVWEHSDRVVCTHPGWSTLTGWPSVASSFYALFDGPGVNQFLLTAQNVEVDGDVAWVTLVENLLGDHSGAAIATLNLFSRRSGRWLLVAHHSGAVVAPAAP
ncbi:MAG TPA: nuclear transport factor 2 family protein [Acidimicrobiales bacterium]|nr:nuclear transport factor 2 family protein [Acidimicrobiales bacterium]